MSADFENALSSLTKMLSTDDGKEKLMNILGSFTGQSNGNTDESEAYGQREFQSENDGSAFKGDYKNPFNEQGNILSDFNPRMLSGIQNIISQLGDNNDSGSQLLLALKPYLRNSRAANIETAIKLMSIGKIPQVIKGMKR